MKKVIYVTLWGSLFTATVLCSPAFSMLKNNLPLSNDDTLVTRATLPSLQSVAERLGAANLRRVLEVLANGGDSTDRFPVADTTVATASSMNFDEETGERGGAAGAGVDVLPQPLLELSVAAQRALEKELGAESAGEERIPSPRDVQDNLFHTPQDYEEVDMRRAHAHLAALEGQEQFMRDRLNARAELRRTLLDKGLEELWSKAHRLCWEAFEHSAEARWRFERFEEAMIHFEVVAERTGGLLYEQEFLRTIERAQALDLAASAAFEAARALEAAPAVFAREDRLVFIADLYQHAIALHCKKLATLSDAEIWEKTNSILKRRNFEEVLAKFNQSIVHGARAGGAIATSDKLGEEFSFHPNWMAACRLQQDIEKYLKEGEIVRASVKSEKLRDALLTIAASAPLIEQVQACEMLGTCEMRFANQLLLKLSDPQNDPEYRPHFLDKAAERYTAAFRCIMYAYNQWKARDKKERCGDELEAKLHNVLMVAQETIFNAGFSLGVNEKGEYVVFDREQQEEQQIGTSKAAKKKYS